LHSTLYAEAVYKDYTTNGVSTVKSAIYPVLKGTGKFAKAKYIQIQFINPTANNLVQPNVVYYPHLDE
jgi:hypothetical protein